ncbi:MAG: glycosyltransferase, partial [Coriobacteriia bacterium]|nr:glycosyltransferase [Coriobacteriia bacterium]
LANNVGIRRSRGRHILILNPDTVIDSGCLTRVLRAVRRLPHTGLVGCRLYGALGEQASTYRPHTLARDFARLIGVLPLWDALSRRLPARREGRRVGGVTGAFMLAPATVLNEVDGFDESIFMYGEDVDLCHRISCAGYRIYYVRSARCRHTHNASGVDDATRLRKHFGAIRTFYQRHQSGLSYRLFLLTLLATYPVRAAALRIVARRGHVGSTRLLRERVYAEEAASDLFTTRLRRGHPAPPPREGRIDIFSPWLAYPVVFAAYYTIGLLLPLDYVGGRLPLGQAAYHALGLVAYLAGVRLSGTGRTAPRIDRASVPGLSVYKRRATFAVAAGLLACAYLFLRFGLRGFDYQFRFSDAPGWTFYLLFTLVTGVFGLTLLELWRPGGRQGRLLLLGLTVLTGGLVMAFGSRSPLFIAVLLVAISFHYVVSRIRLRHFVGLAVAVFLGVTVLGFLRAVGDPGRAEWYTRNAVRYGVPEWAVPMAPGLLALRNGPGHLEVIRRVYP